MKPMPASQSIGVEAGAVKPMALVLQALRGKPIRMPQEAKQVSKGFP
jgi:hypothetical protein